MPALPRPPIGDGIPPLLTQWANAVTESLDQLLGNTSNKTYTAITADALSGLAEPPRQQVQRSAAVGGGFTVSSVYCAGGRDHELLVADVQRTLQDIKALRDHVAELQKRISRK